MVASATPARSAISWVEAPLYPFSANTWMAASRICFCFWVCRWSGSRLTSYSSAIVLTHSSQLLLVIITTSTNHIGNNVLQRRPLPEPGTEPALNLAHTSGKYDPPSFHQGHLVATLRFIQLRRAALGPLIKLFPEQPARERIHTAGRLVQHQQERRMDQSGGKGDALAQSSSQRVNRPVNRLPQAPIPPRGPPAGRKVRTAVRKNRDSPTP